MSAADPERATDRWRRVEALYHAMLARPPEERAAVLLDACPDDPALAAEVQSLLDQPDTAAGLLEARALEVAAGLVVPESSSGLGGEEGLTQERSSLIGRTLSHYEVLSELRRGGMGVVYRARDLKLGREVAFKVLLPEVLSDPERRRRFELEARAAGGLSHSNIGVIYEVDEVEDVVFIAMELIAGEPLDKLIARGPLTVPRALDLGIQVAEGLSRAHEKGIVHRDLKPANVMVTEDGHAKIIDFGLAKLLEPSGDALSELETAKGQRTKAGAVMGTAAYMSPEQARGLKVDARSDVFSFGVLLHELLTGQRPFGGPSRLDVLQAIVGAQAPRLGRTDATAEVQRIVDKCLAKDPGERYQEIRDAVVDLRAERRRLEPGSASTPSFPAAATNYGPIALVATILVAVLALLMARPALRWPAMSPVPSSARPMVLVLPFDNLGSPDEASFAAGITDEITSRLSRLSGLGVISRATAVGYNRSGKTLKQVAQEFGAGYVLEGSVGWDQSADKMRRVRIAPRLVRVSDDTRLWADLFDRVLDDVFVIQAEIAEAVARELEVTLQAGEQRAIAVRPTENLDAYEAFLRGLALYRRSYNTKEGLEQTLSAFDEAISLDAGFAVAHAWRSQVQIELFGFYDPTPQRLEAARDAAAQALRLNPGLPEGHRALGMYYYRGRRNFEAAIAELEQALNGLPNDPDILRGMGSIRKRQGRFDESVALLQRAVSLEPGSAEMAQDLAGVLEALRRTEEADRYLNLAVSIAPDSPLPRLQRILVLQLRGDLERSRSLLETEPDDRGGFVAGPTISMTITAWVIQETLERRFQAALDRLAAAGPDALGGPINFPPLPGPPEALVRGRLRFLMKDREGARVAFREAVPVLEANVAKHAEDPRGHSALAEAYAGSGRTPDAIREARQAVALLPLAKDAYNGFYPLLSLAIVYTMVGEFESAIDVLDYLVARPGLPRGYLRNGPTWDPLRDSPRFQLLVRDPSTR